MDPWVAGQNKRVTLTYYFKAGGQASNQAVIDTSSDLCRRDSHPLRALNRTKPLARMQIVIATGHLHNAQFLLVRDA